MENRLKFQIVLKINNVHNQARTIDNAQTLAFSCKHFSVKLSAASCSLIPI